MREFQIDIGIVGTAPKKLAAVVRKVRPALVSGMRDWLGEIFRVSQQLISGDALKVRTGHLRGSGFYKAEETATGVQGTIGYRAKYAVWLDQGTRPYTIRPKNAKALRFLGADGKSVFAKVVHHPGLRPRHFLSGPVVAHKSLLAGRLREVILQTVNEA